MINWLTNEAISNYIVFIMGLIVGLLAKIITAYLQKRKPSIIEVQKEKETSLISVSPEARKRLQISYSEPYSQKKPRLIDELQQITLRVVNKGEQPIQNIEIGIVLENTDPDDFLDKIVEDPLWDNRDSKCELHYTPDGDLEIWICTSFINPYREHNDVIRVQIYSSKEINIKTVVGGGLGWSAKYFDKIAYDAKVTQTIVQFAKIFLQTSYK